MAADKDDRGIINGKSDNSLGETSFEGRLHLKNFVFKGPSQNPSSISSPRRSQRLSTSTTPQSVVSSQPSPSPSLSSSEAPTNSKKRKTRLGTSDAEESSNSNSNSSSRKTTPLTTPASASPKKKRSRGPSSSYAPPSTYAHLPLLPDAIAPNLLILFIGLNPGLQTARVGHAYAHPSNLFWKLLHSSGITPVRCRAHEDQTMPARFALGHTNIVARPSRSGAELSRAEMDQGVAVLEAKCRRWRPEVACITGKSIWESVFRVRRGRSLAKGEFKYGWQEERMGVVVADGKNGDGGGGDEPWEGTRVFVATSTSGLAATLRPEEKERIWKILGDWCVERRKEREDAAAAAAVVVVAEDSKDFGTSNLT
ncbi:DNA glycosylase [Daldinia caldariorum]|uniref:DNA glycosylase n=1 Tax=Daldinia caldariorum TaxID=326644 RepID=UPI002007D435|nr:DNA glycosylase [Daldinia caldariorum]KAI1464195.1 DNA glycosylase [Daldinia caldariorum]